MKCDMVLSALVKMQCEETEDGARVLTHCLYPNFTQVPVFVQTHLDGFLVHDGGACFDFAYDDGHNPSIVKGLMREFSALYGADTDDHRIFARALSPMWLQSTVLSVANASAAVTTAMVTGAADERTEDREFREHTYLTLCNAFKEKNVPRRVKQRGRTGKVYTFAFAVNHKDTIALVDTVVPNAISVASRFTSFSAIGGRKNQGAFLAYNRPLANEDSALLAEVADVVPLEALVASIEREFNVQNRVR